MAVTELINKVITVGDRTVVNYNLPQYYDVILQALPSNTNFEATSLSLTYQGNVIDFNTGTTTEYLLQPRVISAGEMGLCAFDRDAINQIVDFSMTVEGRYRSFWQSLLTPAYEITFYSPEYFPTIGGVQYLFGQDSIVNDNRQRFYAKNWGQHKRFNKQQRLLAIYVNGYTECYWTRVTDCKLTEDPRVLQVDVEHQLPQIRAIDIDVVTEYFYSSLASDDTELNYVTSEVMTTTSSYIEDLYGAYNPWTTYPPNVPNDEEII